MAAGLLRPGPVTGVPATRPARERRPEPGTGSANRPPISGTRATAYTATSPVVPSAPSARAGGADGGPQGYGETVPAR